MEGCLVFQQHEHGPPGLLAEWAADAGVRLEVRRLDGGDAVPAPARGLTGVLVLGAPHGPEPASPWRAPLQRFITVAIARSVPLLSIGSGAHLAALALGGVAAARAADPVRGLWPVRLTPEGRSDAVFGALPGRARWVQSGPSLFADLPVGAVVLADDGRGLVQAVRFGPRAWGLHGHPEADAAIAARWFDLEGRAAGAEGATEAIRALTWFRRIEPELRRTWAPVAAAFFALVAGGPGGRAPTTASPTRDGRPAG